MKPSSQYDFPVFVRRQTWEEAADEARYYEGIFDVNVNNIFGVMFVPAPERTVWPPMLPESTGAVVSENDARSLCLALSRYTVIPDNALAGQEQTFARDWSESGPGVVFFVKEAEFATLSSELAMLADERPSVHSGWKVSEISNLSVTRLLLHRILDSSSVPQKDRDMLGRPA